MPLMRWPQCSTKAMSCKSFNTFLASEPHDAASLGAACGIRDKLSWPGDLLQEISETKAKQVKLMEIQLAGQGAYHQSAMNLWMHDTSGKELPAGPLYPTTPPPQNMPQKLLVLSCRRKAGCKYLRCAWLDHAGEESLIRSLFHALMIVLSCSGRQAVYSRQQRSRSVQMEGALLFARWAELLLVQLACRSSTPSYYPTCQWIWL
jgi:hypothetical protein